MSSARKDARWQLATTLANEAGLDDLGVLDYPVAQRLLDAAEAVLDFVPEATIQALADKWNYPPTPTAKLCALVAGTESPHDAWERALDSALAERDRARNVGGTP